MTDMADNKQPLQLSIFDRLHPSGSASPGSLMSDLDIVRAAVLRDFENLLNTRRRIVAPPENFKYLADSLYTYGIEDFVAKNPKNPQVRQALMTTIHSTIVKFEPRLRNVSVDFKADEGNSQNLCFSVRATLYAEPVREPICFDTWFSASRGEYKINNVK
jgi:type VI secretion system protein ImpF